MWPAQQRDQVIKDGFQMQRELPGVRGAIDGSLVLIKAPGK